MERNEYIVDEFDDIRILRYDVPAFSGKSLREKLFIYYLSQAALAGRDILWDQNNRYNLQVRRVIEKILTAHTIDRSDSEFEAFVVYAKKVFFANGIHHHYSMEKFQPAFKEESLKAWMEAVGIGDQFDGLQKVIFDPLYMSRRVVLDEGTDLLRASANNYYEGVSQQEAEDFYKKQPVDENCPISKGLNSTLVKRNGHLAEEVWKEGGKYGREISRIIYWLEKALAYACTERQQKGMRLLIDYYKTGDLSLFDAYSIEWLKEQKAGIDFINGFIEVYGDPLGFKGSWESVVEIVDEEASKRTRQLAENALWFEQHAPIEDRFKKTEGAGIVAKVMQVAMLGGDCYPATPIGINLPNAEWIREKYGSKSVTLDNITYAYHMASLGSGILDEFAYSEREKRLAEKYGYLAGNVHTDLHECLGHGSGKMLTGVSVAVLKNYYSTLEEARADLFALYYMMDDRLVELGIIPSLEVGECEYNQYIRNGLMTQLTRIKKGANLEEAHMRNRQLIASWAYEKGKSANVIEKVKREGKTYFVIHDYQALRYLWGCLLREVQRIKSEGDFEAARTLIETYGVKIDVELHCEVLERYERLRIPPYSGFINPHYELVMNGEEITDVRMSYPKDFLTQMLQYGNLGKQP